MILTDNNISVLNLPSSVILTLILVAVSVAETAVLVHLTNYKLTTV